MIRVVLDAMGGDNAPYATVEGALRAREELKDLEIVLVGREDIVRPLLSNNMERVKIYNASENIGMDENISLAIRRKKDSSIRRGIELIKQGKAHAFVSAGHSGAVMATSLLLLGRIKGVKRPAIAASMPTLKGRVLLIDAGANVDITAEYLLQFALMGDAYCRKMLNIANPRVAILSIGEEDTKGNDLTKDAFRLIKQTGLNFVGNIEGKDIFKGDVDVVVCDGFIGNVVLKLSEGLAEVIMEMLKGHIGNSFLARLAYPLLKPAIKRFKRKTDYAEYGGAPLLGVRGISIICHGRSNGKAIYNAIKVAYKYVQKDLNKVIEESLTHHISSSTAGLASVTA